MAKTKTWRDCLTKKEARELFDLELQASNLDNRRRLLTVRMNTLRNRSAQRLRYERLNRKRST